MTYTKDQIDALTKNFTEAAKNINRILVKWVKEANRKTTHFKFSVTEIRSLVKGELIRVFRQGQSSLSLNHILSRAHLFIDADTEIGFIKSLTLGECDRWSTYQAETTDIRKILESIPYSTLKYDESIEETSSMETLMLGGNSSFNPNFLLNFKDLEKINFLTTK